MKPMNQLLCAAALMLIVATPASYADAQTATGRALFAYPMKGQTPDQENLDRAACHDWAVAQSGFDTASRHIDQVHCHVRHTGGLCSFL
jgi:hypothetical protein